MHRLHRLAGATAVAALAAAFAVAPVAAGFSPDAVIWTDGAGRSPQVTSVATAGARVAVGWVEDIAPEGGDPTAWIRTSANGGKTFGAALPIDVGNEHELQLAICGGRYLYAVYAVDLRSLPYPHKWTIILYERDLMNGDDSYEEISWTNGEARYPHVACGSDRVWIAWDDKEPGDARHLFVTHSIVGPPGAHAWKLPALDLGPAPTNQNGPTVAAVTGHAYVAWAQSAGHAVVKLKHFTVGGGPGFPVSGHPTQTIAAPGNDVDLPLLAASGAHVALCYVRGGSGGGAYVRVSGNHAASFGSPRKLKQLAQTTGLPESIAMSGNQIMVVSAIYFEGQTDTYRYRSSNAGSSFTRTSLGNDRGNRIGAFKGSTAHPKIVEAWDGQGSNGRKVFFHREL